MTITLNIKNEQLFKKILAFLNLLKKDDLEIIAEKNTKVKRKAGGYEDQIKIAPDFDKTSEYIIRAFEGK